MFLPNESVRRAKGNADLCYTNWTIGPAWQVRVLQWCTVFFLVNLLDLKYEVKMSSLICSIQLAINLLWQKSFAQHEPSRMVH